MGRPLKWHWRDIINAIFYVVKTGCQWRFLPDSYPPWQTVYRHYRQFNQAEWWCKLNEQLSKAWREQSDKKADPSAASIDSQSYKASETGSHHGYDAGKHIKGTKRHLLVDTQGLVITALCSSAAVQDCNAAKAVFDKAVASGRADSLKLIWADGGYNRNNVKTAVNELGWQLEIIQPASDVKGFQVLPRRWVVERTFGWLLHNRRLVRDYERRTSTAESLIYISMCRLLLKRLARL
jgi:transposase